jgi:hypothetical protein
MLDAVMIKFNEAVWHDQPYVHPQRGFEMARDFYNREKEKTRLESLLKARSRNPAIIVGERRSGKTSLLKLLNDHLSSDESHHFVPILIPWQGVQSRDELAEEILSGLRRQIGKKFPAIELPSLDRRTPATNTEFIEALDQLLTPLVGSTAIICIDELDSILVEAPSDERERIGGLVGTLVERVDLTIGLLLTMARPPNALPDTRLAKLIAKSEIVPLHPFSEDSFHEMIDGLTSGAVRLSLEDRKLLFDLAGGWPYFGKLLLVALAEIDYDQHWLTRALPIAMKHPNLEDMLRNIYFEHFDDHEKAVALLLAANHGRVGAEKIAASGTALKAAIMRLSERDFVTIEDSGSYRFRIGFLAEWFPKWPLFETELERRLRRLDDPWAGSRPTVVTDEDVNRFRL